MKRWILIAAAPLVVAVSMLATSSAQPAPATETPTTAPATTRPTDFRVRLNDRGPRDVMRPGMRGEIRDDHFPDGDHPPGPPPDGFGGGDGPPGMGGPMGGGPGGMGTRRPPSVDTMRNYLELVDRYAAMSSDPVKAGVGAVITAADLLRAQGNDAAIKYFEAMLADTSKPLLPEIDRAIRLQLAELYKAAGQSDKALEQLKQVMQAKK